MKIIFLTTKLNLVTGGGSNTNLDFKARILADAGHDVSVITVYPKGNNVSDTPYKVIEKDIGAISPKNVRLKTAELLKEYEKDTDLFHVDGHMFVWGAGLYKEQGGETRVIAHFDNYLLTMGVSGMHDLSLRSKISFKVLRLWEIIKGLGEANKVDMFTCASQKTAELYAKHGLDKEKMKVMPPLLDTTPFTRIIKKPHDKFTILYIGRLHADKGLDLLFEAIKDLNVKVQVVGAGHHEEDIKKEAPKNVEFHSWKSQKEIKDFYAEADVFVHPAIWPEPFGMTIIEAMASGVPVITSSDTGGTEIAKDAGLIFANNSAEDLRKNIKMMIESKSLRQELIEKGKRKAEEYDQKKWSKYFLNEIIGS